jgi:hypothetical protein
VNAVDIGTFAPEELKKLHRLGDHPAVATLTPDQGDRVRVAVAAEDRSALLGPYTSPVPEA